MSGTPSIELFPCRIGPCGSRITESACRRQHAHALALARKPQRQQNGRSTYSIPSAHSLRLAGRDRCVDCPGCRVLAETPEERRTP